MCDPVTLVAGSAILGAGMSYLQGEKQQKAMKQATAQSAAAAEKQAQLAEKEINKSEAKQPNYAAFYDANQQEAQGGPSSTSLTGPQGVDLSKLLLGKNTILGA